MWQLWLSSNIVQVDTRARLYRATIEPILLYDGAAQGATQLQMDRLDAAHRKQLQLLLRIYYPNRITNEELNTRTQCQPISRTITKLKWAMFGHILRGPVDGPAHLAMRRYYAQKQVGRGKLATSIATCLQDNLKLINRRLKGWEDLEVLRGIAQDRHNWKNMSMEIVEAYKQQSEARRANRKEATRRRRDRVQNQPQVPINLAI